MEHLEDIENRPEIVVNRVIADPDENVEDVTSRAPAYCFYCGLRVTQRRSLIDHTKRVHSFEQQARSTTKQKAETILRDRSNGQDREPEGTRAPTRKRQRLSRPERQQEELTVEERIPIPDALLNLEAVRFDMEEFSTNLQMCKTVDEVIYLGQSFWKCPTFNAILCVPCHLQNPRRGKITYIFGMAEEDFSDVTNLPWHFRDLKKKIKDHVCTQHHLKISDPNLLLTGEELTDRNLFAAITIGREVYAMIKGGHTYNSFEERLAVLAGHGLDIGDINHSSEMMRRLVPCLFLALKEQVVKEFKQELPGTQRPSFFSVSADKATIVKDTLHIIMALFINNGTFKPYLLWSSINKDGNGLGLGEEIYGALRDFMEPDFIRAQCIGGAWDGGYVNVKPEISLMEKLGTTWPKFLSWSWDASHVLELVMKKARGEDSNGKIKVKWIRKLFATITKVRDHYNYGKQWNDLVTFTSTDFRKPLLAALQDFEEISEIKRRRPVVMPGFVTTRFQTYLESVLEAVLKNYRLIFLELSEKEDPILNEISNASFVLRLCMMQDLNRVISVLSQQIQKVDTFTWIILDQIDVFLEKLDNLHEIFKDVMNYIDNPNIPKTSRAIKELTKCGTFRQCPITNDRQSHAARTRGMEHNDSMQDSDFREKINDVSLEVCKYIQDISDAYQDRLAKSKVIPDILRQTRNVFSVSRIIANEGRAHEDLKTLFESAASWWNSDVSEEDFLGQYARFTSYVLATVDGNATIEDGDPPQRDDQRIYFDLLHAPEKCQAFKDVAVLLSASMARTFCEAVTEGVASTLKDQIEGRESLHKDRLFQEVFLRYHGPDCSPEHCDGLAYRAMEIYWGARPWKFVRKCKPPKVKVVRTSIAVDKTIQKPAEMQVSPIPLPPLIEARLARIRAKLSLKD